ncbi:MAG: DUF4910 domain-containing protein [Planctomycetia bacterium]|nr:DUF4910 domain-containing protein [Planctomycetia bacterium]
MDTPLPDPSANALDVGYEMYALVEQLFPICRSITGPGVRETLAILQELVPLEIREVPTGTQVFDWVVPREWQIRDAYIQAPDGQRVVDFQESNLHVVSYSTPVRARMKWKDLQPHLHTLPDEPDRVPYRTSYYQETWGFCLSQCQWITMKRMYGEEAEYEVCIDSTLAPGSLTYGELYLPGSTTDEVVISCHVCHPSLANDNLSGIAVATHLARHVAALPERRYSYRFLFIPGTIGAITWLAQNEANLGRIRHGLVLSLLGIPARTHYKRSRRGDAEIDRAVAHVLKNSGAEFALLDFEPYGYDERQYCSPGLNLPFGCLSRTPYGRYSQYHTSADNLDLVHPEALAGSLAHCATIVEVLEGNGAFVNQKPKCEPQLGRRGLYSAIGGGQEKRNTELALLWVLNQSDGQHTLLDIAERSGLAFKDIRRAADLLLSHQLLTEV